MKNLEITDSLTSQGGGVAIAVQSLGVALADLGIAVEFAAILDGGVPLTGWGSHTPHFCQPAFPKKLIPSSGLVDLLSKSDLLHSHGLWSAVSLAVSSCGSRKHIPWIVSPHGMLDPWALKNSRWKKRIAAALFENRHLHGAACVHALCQSEAESIRAYGLKNPVATIPNGVCLPERQGVEGRASRDEGADEVGVEWATDAKRSAADVGFVSDRYAVFREDNENRRTRDALPATRNAPLRLLFLGRLHPKKGLVPALRAWAATRHSPLATRHSEWQFVIAGWDQGGHEAELKRLCSELGIRYSETPASSVECRVSSAEADVVFYGPAFGETKDALLRSADAFILPSLSEGLPMSVLEAWAYGLPVLMTPECNLPEGFAADAAIRIAHDAEPEPRSVQASVIQERETTIEEGIRELFSISDSERVAMGERGRRLVEERFTWPQVAAQMKAVYEWGLGGGLPPDCVRTARG